MKIIKINPKDIKKQEIDFIADYLKQGKVVVLPTDTIYGLSAIATSKKSVEKVHKIKKSDKNKPLIVLVKSYCMLKKYAKVSRKQDDFLRSIWPTTTREAAINSGKKITRPVTVILDVKNKKIKPACGKQLNIAVRLPKNEFIYKIISKVGIPLVSSSFNLANKRPPEDFKNLEKEFKILPDLIVDAGKVKKNKPSRLIDIIDINNIKILRK